MHSIVITIMSVSLFFGVQGAVRLEDFGGVAGVQTVEVADKNADAFLKALQFANSSDDRTVEIPDGSSYYMSGLVIEDIMNVRIEFSGEFVIQDHLKSWPIDVEAAFYFTKCIGIHIDGNGNGKIDGQGTLWWRVMYLSYPNKRPNLFKFVTCRDLSIANIYMLSSPRYSIQYDDCADVVVHDVTIFIDPSIQRGLDRHDSVTYALNTDGIDIAAYNVTIYNTNITNYDDAIVAKPCRSTGVYCQCAGAINAYDNTIKYSTGLTIGSVPPNDNVNCIRGVYFRDTTMYRPLKAIYIKSNPGDTGTGIIDDITYENIYIEEALWWTVYIGPQQQNQPGGDSGTGCNFLFPFVPVCPTQPRITMSRITLRNVTAVNTLPTFEGPGIVLCDPENPCTDILFEDVTNTVFTGTSEFILTTILS